MTVKQKERKMIHVNQYIYSKRLNCTAVAHGKTTQNRLCVHYPDKSYGQILVGRNNILINKDQFELINAAHQKRTLKRKNQAAKDLIAKADQLIKSF